MAQGRSLTQVASIVAVATLLSKGMGLLRQVAIAAVYGVGVAYDAYNYAYVVPGFLLVLLGGINGPFHSAIVSALAKREPQEAATIVETVNSLVSVALLLLAVGLWLGAEGITDLFAPGLRSGGATGLEIRAIAIEQLRIMTPMAVLAGLIGVGFGSLNAANQYWLPAVSPLLSSLAVLGGVGGLVWLLGERVVLPEYAVLGGRVLAYSTLAGAVGQWLAQVWAQWRSGVGSLRLRWQWQHPGVREVLRVMVPATLSSGTLQINVYTDLFFASYLPAAASALGYAGLLVQTPLGILSNVILVPLFPVLSRLAAPEDWPQLKERIRQGLWLTGLFMLPLGALMMVLARPIVALVYERFAFGGEATSLVAAVLVAYSLGMFVYLGRDVLVRVFYALGDGETPFRISVVNIFLNVLLDAVLVQWLAAPGLVLATVGVNAFSMVWLMVGLHRRLGGLDWGGRSLLGLALASGLAAAGSWLCLAGLVVLLPGSVWWIRVVHLAIAGAVGLGI
ncbi:MAG: murein biosynthesis integral membrane protein MurJ [Oscillatoriales cyanobacterium SM2_2_1]|nr:murein biosynthesis integral membrane protein MurJ [Oscillatoriales cyanobacterium SM2_2_1]